jgi:hypothetical protein
MDHAIFVASFVDFPTKLPERGMILTWSLDNTSRRSVSRGRSDIMCQKKPPKLEFDEYDLSGVCVGITRHHGVHM